MKFYFPLTGILNVLNVLSAALIDQKILFYSCSYARLTEACNALTALMYPFKYRLVNWALKI